MHNLEKDVDKSTKLINLGISMEYLQLKFHNLVAHLSKFAWWVTGIILNISYKSFMQNKILATNTSSHI